MNVRRGVSKDGRRGIKCSRCGCRHLLVVYTRPRDGHIVRGKVCRHCGKKILTRESSF
jgi:DNA-directed RNA polymerase subunit RPC12/RpoP